MTNEHSLLSALLKYWRKRRGYSQLDLALAANMSARHISFIETGRSKPSRASLLVIADTLQVPLREQNKLLVAAGYVGEYLEAGFDTLSTTPVGKAIEYMLARHDPLPMVVMDGAYNLLTLNGSAQQVLKIFVHDPAQLVQPVNLLDTIFNPDLCKPYIVDWEVSAHHMLSRLYRESLEKQHDKRLTDLVNRLLAYPDVCESWCQPDFAHECEPTATLTLQRGTWHLSFLMSMTKFSAPQNIMLEEMMIESYFPLDASTEDQCRELSSQAKSEVAS